MPTDPNPEVIESVKSALRLVSDFETAAAVLHRALETAKANGLGREAAVAVVANVFSEPAADVHPAVSEPSVVEAEPTVDEPASKADPIEAVTEPVSTNEADTTT